MILIINIITQIILDVYITIPLFKHFSFELSSKFSQKIWLAFYHNTNNQINFQLNTDSIKDNLDFM